MRYDQSLRSSRYHRLVGTHSPLRITGWVKSYPFAEMMRLLRSSG
jgi:hypothetical protein